MRKFLNLFKIVLFILLLVLNIVYLVTFFNPYPIYIVYLILLIIFGVLIVRDLLRHDKINYDITYNVLCICILLIMIFIIGRTLFDQNFLYNSIYYRNLIEEYNLNLAQNSGYRVDVKITNVYYVLQNSLYFIIMFILIFIYRKLNIEKKN